MKTFCFDLDGVLCTNTWGEYDKANPISLAINKVNLLYDKGHKIIIFTARYMGISDEDINTAYTKGYDLTKSQIDSWGIKYHKLILGKPSYDVIIDDKHYNYSDSWLDHNFK